MIRKCYERQVTLFSYREDNCKMEHFGEESSHERVNHLNPPHFSPKHRIQKALAQKTCSPSHKTVSQQGQRGGRCIQPSACLAGRVSSSSSWEVMTWHVRRKTSTSTRKGKTGSISLKWNNQDTNMKLRAGNLLASNLAKRKSYSSLQKLWKQSVSA